MPRSPFTYDKYLTAEPTQLMEHIEQWIRDKTGFDPTKAKTKAEAFALGVYLTVALRGHHQASEENQERLERNRLMAEEADAERADRRAAREAAGAKPRGRLPKAAQEPEAETPAPKRRGRPKKAAETPAPESTSSEPPKRRGRPKKATTDTAEAEASNVTPIRRRRPAAAPKAEEASKPAPAAATPNEAPKRRRPVRRGGEAAF